MKALYKILFIIFMLIIIASTLFLVVYKEEYFNYLADSIVQENSINIENIRKSTVPQSNNLLDTSLLETAKFKNLENNMSPQVGSQTGNRNPFNPF